MYTLLRIVVVMSSMALIGACGDDGGNIEGDGAVASLSDGELQDLCEQFHDEACQGASDSFCAPSCRVTCSAAGTAELMRQECAAPITIDEVNECAQLFGSGDDSAFEVCSRGGGCVFDVFDVNCADPS